MRILILGISGLIGSTVFRVLSEDNVLDVYGTYRDPSTLEYFPKINKHKMKHMHDVRAINSVLMCINEVKPDVIINCVGITKHVEESDSPTFVLPINTLWPHELSQICAKHQIRLIHISSDCVFSGDKGDYTEEETPDAKDLYGRSKALGEPIGTNDLTLRISTIGPELGTNYGLLNWFLMQGDSCRGYVNAVFSGIPTVFFASVLRDYVLPNYNLRGTYHISSDPIDKFTLLNMIALEYKKKISIIPDDSLKINRSLNSTKFRNMTNYLSPSWTDLIKMMANNQ